MDGSCSTSLIHSPTLRWRWTLHQRRTRAGARKGRVASKGKGGGYKLLLGLETTCHCHAKQEVDTREIVGHRVLRNEQLYYGLPAVMGLSIRYFRLHKFLLLTSFSFSSLTLSLKMVSEVGNIFRG